MGIPNEEYWRRALENFFNELPGPPLIWIQSCMQPLTVQIKEEAIFTCICGNVWGSINSIIIFEYYSNYNYVSLHIFGQNCFRCRNSAYLPPYFRGDAIEFAVHLLLLEVLYWCYGRDTSLELEIARRSRVLVGRGNMTGLNARLVFKDFANRNEALEVPEGTMTLSTMCTIHTVQFGLWIFVITLMAKKAIN